MSFEIDYKTIDIKNWKRKAFFESFMEYDFPYFIVGQDFDISQVIKFSKELNISSHMVIIHCMTKAANSVEEFRLRIRNNDVILHKVTHPGYMIPDKNNIPSSVHAPYQENLFDFIQEAQNKKYIKGESYGQSNKIDDHILFLSCNPWFNFTHVLQPVKNLHHDSIPKIVWGKYTEKNNKITLPLSLMGHHALIDGYLIGQFFDSLQNIFDQIFDNATDHHKGAA